MTVTVERRPVPDSALGTIEVAILYGGGGIGREQFFLDIPSQAVRAREVLKGFLNDLNPLGQPIHVPTNSQREALAKAREARHAVKGETA